MLIINALAFALLVLGASTQALSLTPMVAIGVQLQDIRSRQSMPTRMNQLAEIAAHVWRIIQLRWQLSNVTDQGLLGRKLSGRQPCWLKGDPLESCKASILPRKLNELLQTKVKTYLKVLMACQALADVMQRIQDLLAKVR